MKHAQNPIKNEHELIKQIDKPADEGEVNLKYLFSEWWEKFWYELRRRMMAPTLEGRTSTILHPNGWTSCHTNCKMCFNLNFSSHPESK